MLNCRETGFGEIVPANSPPGWGKTRIALFCDDGGYMTATVNTRSFALSTAIWARWITNTISRNRVIRL
jgi:hypothetical protein